MITTIFQEKSNTYHIAGPIIGRFFPNLVLVRSLRSSFIDSLSSAKKRCNTSQGFGTFFGQSYDRDSLSPYLFIIALETLAIRIRSDSQIQGFKIGEEIVKLLLFPDGMTCILRDRNAYTALFHILKSFGNQSGLTVNHEETDILSLGNNTTQHNACKVIKILGVHFGYDLKERDTLNFRQTLKAIMKSINMWKWRGVSIKTFTIPKLMYRASVITISKELNFL